MKALKGIALTAVLASAVACASQQQPSAEDDARDIDALNAMLAEHVAAVNSGDTATNLAGFTEDLVYLPPAGLPVRGKPALASFIGSFYEVFEAEIEMVPEETILMGDWAFQWGTITGTVWPLEGGESVPLIGKWAYLYQRQPGGTWKIARDIYNSEPPAANE
jgi:ketosteroid isomerase-like protein